MGSSADLVYLTEDEQEFRRELQSIHCTFNLDCARLPTQAYTEVKHRLQQERNLIEYDDMDTVRIANLWTWILFNLDDKSGAIEASNEVLERYSVNLVSLGNAAFISWNSGDEQQAKKYLEIVNTMKRQDNYDYLVNDAKAQEAYTFRKLGGAKHLLKSFEMYKEIVIKYPDNFLWKLDLGLVCKRLTNMNVSISDIAVVDVNIYFNEALRLLFEVAEENRASSQLRAHAYALLCNMRSFYSTSEYNSYFKNSHVVDLCHKSFELCNTYASALTECGKSVRYYDADMAIDLLKRSLELREHGTTYHHLGKCWKKMADHRARGKYHPRRKNVKHNDTRMYSEQPMLNTSRLCQTAKRRGKTIHGNTRDTHHRNNITRLAHSADIFPSEGSGIKHSTIENEVLPTMLSQQRRRARSSVNFIPLDTCDPFVIDAIICYKKAITISHEQNMPAIYDLGLILKSTGKLKEALGYFNKLIRTSSYWGVFTFISAHEQAGICLEMMHKLEPAKGYDSAAKLKFTKAVSLAANLASGVSEMRYCARDVWNSFRMLENQFKKGRQQKELVKLLTLVKEYHHIIPVISDIRNKSDHMLDDREVVQVALESYLKTGQPEEALTFLSLIKIRPDCPELPVDVEMRIVLSVIRDRLTGPDHDDVTYLFRQLFDSLYKLSPLTHDEDAERENRLHVIIFYDDLGDSEEGLSAITHHARHLMKVFDQMFGLNTTLNLHGCMTFETKVADQLQFLTEHALVLVLLGDEKEESTYFSNLLKLAIGLPCGQDTKLRQMKVLIVDQKRNITKHKLPFQQKYLYEFGHFKLSSEMSACVNDGTYLDVLHDVFNGDVSSLMELFGFLVGVDVNTLLEPRVFTDLSATRWRDTPETSWH